MPLNAVSLGIEILYFLLSAGLRPGTFGCTTSSEWESVLLSVLCTGDAVVLHPRDWWGTGGFRRGLVLTGGAHCACIGDVTESIGGTLFADGAQVPFVDQFFAVKT